MLDSDNILGLLPVNIIERVLLHLPTSDIISFSQTSRLSKDVALAELFWLRILDQRWGHLTRPKEWISDGPLGCFELHSSRHRFPGSYRCSYIA